MGEWLRWWVEGDRPYKGGRRSPQRCACAAAPRTPNPGEQRALRGPPPPRGRAHSAPAPPRTSTPSAPPRPPHRAPLTPAPLPAPVPLAPLRSPRAAPSFPAIRAGTRRGHPHPSGPGSLMRGGRSGGESGGLLSIGPLPRRLFSHWLAPPEEEGVAHRGHAYRLYKLRPAASLPHSRAGGGRGRSPPFPPAEQRPLAAAHAQGKAVAARLRGPPWRLSLRPSWSRRLLLRLLPLPEAGRKKKKLHPPWRRPGRGTASGRREEGSDEAAAGPNSRPGNGVAGRLRNAARCFPPSSF